MVSIQRLEVAEFQGVTRSLDIVFENKSLVLIYGPAGSGKSTVVNALDYA